ncbi:MAG: tRNA 2-thiouridine(34) synthase MnmA [Actinobacteria bacterium]|nr:tRNA 2-thiouridine(34) synthase MnmA [Actinomycetota bacterium]
MPEIAIALSGGVDSSVAAALLVESGRDVFGVTMRLGLAEIAGRACCGEEEVALARRVCAQLGIPHVVIDIADEFRAEVVEPFCDAYASGLTPNPCVRCNERVKFGAFAQRVRALGATVLTTGHYARVERDADGQAWLARAADEAKDQSYFLYRVAPEVLGELEFPLGDLTKAEVRAMAAERGLPTAERRESQEVCFSSDHVALVGELHPGALEPGPIEDGDGRVLGHHRGIARYTVGQRKGLGVGGPEGPYRVSGIDARRNAVIVEPASGPGVSRVTLTDPVWRLPEASARVSAQVRYQARPVPATATVAAGAIGIAFDEPGEPAAPGQSVVLYQGDRVVGGGIVSA